MEDRQHFYGVNRSKRAKMAGDSKVYKAVDYGANPNGRMVCAAAIQKAIDACLKAIPSRTSC